MRVSSLPGRVGIALSGFAAGCTAAVAALLVAVLATEGWETLSWDFLTSGPREGMTEGGIFPAIAGTTLLVFIATIVAVPAGAVTALYLSEYMDASHPLTRAARYVVTTLAGVPSIVFGLFGLAFFVHFAGAGLDRLSGDSTLHWGQPGLLWAGLTMAVMTLPTVIVAVEESLHSVPPDFREASLALGATRWQAVRTTVIPHALPGVFTGAILATGRAAGEVAPILFTGAAYYLPESIPGLSDQFMALGYHLYVMATQSVDIEGTRGIQAATALVLLSLTAGLGLLAALLRARLRQRSGR